MLRDETPSLSILDVGSKSVTGRKPPRVECREGGKVREGGKLGDELGSDHRGKGAGTSP